MVGTAAGVYGMVHSSQRVLPTCIRHFSDRQRTILLAVARRSLVNSCVLRQRAQQAVEQAVCAGLASALDEERAALLAEGACFVTLWRGGDGSLRGCRGECSAHQPLVRAVGFMALAAAFDDPRFVSVVVDELPELQIEISVLTLPCRIEPGQVEIGRHGLMIVEGGHRGLLLPQVAVEHHMQRDQFLDAVCWKAGLPRDAWRSAAANLWAFETESWNEFERLDI
jgi:uncharacterized protein